LQAIRAEELSVVKEKERLEVEKTKHMNELRRIRDEDASLFANTKTLNDRYVLQHLLGRGGFSEVYKAVDADGLRAVACKVHQLNSNWPEVRA
jgi:tousled-like kinase